MEMREREKNEQEKNNDHVSEQYQCPGNLPFSPCELSIKYEWLILCAQHRTPVRELRYFAWIKEMMSGKYT